MSKIAVYGLESGRPYAHIQGTDEGKYVHLGVRQFFGNRLPPLFGVDLGKAWSETVPMEAHNALHNYWESRPTHTDTIAMLGLISNALNPTGVQHAHPEFFAKEFHEAIKQPRRNQIGLARIGIKEVKLDITRNPQNYQDENHGTMYLELLSILDQMLGDYPDSMPYQFRFTPHGKLTKIK